MNVLPLSIFPLRQRGRLENQTANEGKPKGESRGKPCYMHGTCIDYSLCREVGMLLTRIYVLGNEAYENRNGRH